MKIALRRKYGKFACPMWGNQDAKIVSISQAPSLSVIRNQKPFLDKADLKPSFKWAEKWLKRELSYLNPKLYLILGRVADENSYYF